MLCCLFPPGCHVAPELAARDYRAVVMEWAAVRIVAYT
jgi:hypothetical protein